MVAELEHLARALRRAGGDDDASRRLLELAAVATMQAAALDAVRDAPAKADTAAAAATPTRLAA